LVGLSAALILAQVVAVDAQIVHRIGALDEPAPEAFGRIADLAVDAEGQIYVLDAQAAEVRVFTAQGQHVRSFGREGDGPGELRQPYALSVGPQGVLVLGRTASRYTKGGEFVERLSFALGVNAASHVREGVFFVHTGASASFRGTNPTETFVVRNAGVADTVLTAPSSTIVFRSPRAAGAYRSPFCDALHHAVLPDETVAVADGRVGELALYQITEDGRAERRASRQVAPAGRPMSEADFDQILERMPAQLNVEREHIQTLEIRSSICGLASASDGRLWVRTDDGEEREAWTAYEGDSLRLLGEVRFPEGVAVKGFSANRAVGVWRDEYGVQYVVVMEVPSVGAGPSSNTQWPAPAA
jgi:6-bladed beta-propeller